MKVVSLLSGGLDSSVLAYKLKSEHQLVKLLLFDYGQRHVKELKSAIQIAYALGVPHYIVDLYTVHPLIQGSALTDQSVNVPEGHYAADNMKITVVPNRNAMMLSIAWAHAVAIGADAVAYAAHAGDAAQYPDCRLSFVVALEKALNIGNEWAGEKHLMSPFVTWTKAEIVKEGARLHVPFERTWSCYAGGEKHCLRCSTCIERHEAFELAGISDPTGYANDEEFYRRTLDNWGKSQET